MKLNNNNESFKNDARNAFESAKSSAIPAGTYTVTLNGCTLRKNEHTNNEAFILSFVIRTGKFNNRRLGPVFLNVNPDLVVVDNKYVWVNGKPQVKIDENGNPTYTGITRKLNVLLGIVNPAAEVVDTTEAIETALRNGNREITFRISIKTRERLGYIEPTYYLSFVKPIVDPNAVEEIDVSESQDLDEALGESQDLSNDTPF